MLASLQSLQYRFPTLSRPQGQAVEIYCWPRSLGWWNLHFLRVTYVVEICWQVFCVTKSFLSSHRLEICHQNLHHIFHNNLDITLGGFSLLEGGVTGTSFSWGNSCQRSTRLCSIGHRQPWRCCHYPSSHTLVKKALDFQRNASLQFLCRTSLTKRVTLPWNIYPANSPRIVNQSTAWQ